MIRWLAFAVVAAIATAPLRAEDTNAARATEPAQSPPAVTSALPTPPSPAESPAAQPDATQEALRKRLAALEPGTTDEERAEHAALVSFYEARNLAPLWLTSPTGLPRAVALVSESSGRRMGLDARDFSLPIEQNNTGAGSRAAGAATKAALTPEQAAESEVGLSRAVLKYGRYARGGRIIHPAEQLSSYLDRRPQLLKPRLILDGIAAADSPEAYLRGLHPQHPQFERLRQKYLVLLGRRAQGKAGNPAGAEAKKLLANMEQWRWMPADMGELYVWNNIPEYTQRVVKGGQVLLAERIVAGEIGKQTPIFTRPMRRITFRPTWKVPESIKVREIWPSLLRGGALMREWDLEIRTKDGQLVDWRKMDWTKTDIREYEVIQPNGRKRDGQGEVLVPQPAPSSCTIRCRATNTCSTRPSARTATDACGCKNPTRLAGALLRRIRAGTQRASPRPSAMARSTTRSPSSARSPCTPRISPQWSATTASCTRFPTSMDMNGALRRRWRVSGTRSPGVAIIWLPSS